MVRTVDPKIPGTVKLKECFSFRDKHVSKRKKKQAYKLEHTVQRRWLLDTSLKMDKQISKL